MIGQPPPYALSRPTFPFPGLAAQAGREVLGGPREAVLGTLVAARLCASLLPPLEISSEHAAARSAQAKNWLGVLALGAGLKNALAGVIEAAGVRDHHAVGGALEKLAASPSSGLDGSSREEIEKLAEEFRARG